MSTQNPGNSQPQYRTSISTQMMEDYLVSTPVSAGTQIVASRTKNGETDVFSIGNDDYVYHIRRDPQSDTGWACRRLDVQAQTITSAPTYSTEKSHDRVFVVTGIDGTKCHLQELIPDEKTGDFSPQFRSTIYAKSCSHLTQCYNPGGVTLAATIDTPSLIDAKAIAVVNVPFQGTTYEYATYGLEDYNEDKDKGTTVQASKVMMIPLGAEDNWNFPELPFTYLWKGELKLACSYNDLYGQRTDNHLLMKNVPIPHLANVVDFSLQQGWVSYNKFFAVAIDSSHELHCISPESGFLRSATTKWPATWTKIDTTTPDNVQPLLQQAIATQNKKGNLIFAADANDKLWSVEQDNSGMWSNITDLGVSVAHFTVINNLDDETELFVVTRNGKLIRMLQDVTGDWLQETIGLQTKGTAERITVYRTTLSIIDQYSAPVPDLSLQVTASQRRPALVNAKSYAIGTEYGVNVKTNMLGQVNITYVVNDSLYVPHLTFYGKMFASFGLTVHPERDVHSLLSGITDATLAAAKNPINGQPVIPARFHNGPDIENIRKSINEAMSMLNQAYEVPDQKSPLFKEIADLRGVRLIDSRKVPMNVSPMVHARQPWQLDFSTGHPRFAVLSPNTSAQIFDTAMAQRADTVAALSSAGIFDIDWGALWRGIESGLIKLVTITIDSSKATLKFVVDGKQYLLGFKLTALEQVFDVVGGIFDMIGTRFSTLSGWILGTLDGLFDWEKIKINKTFLKSTLHSWASELPENLPKMSTLSDDAIQWLEGVKKDFDTWVEKIEKNIGATTIDHTRGKDPDPEQLFVQNGTSFWNKGTWLMDKVQAAIGEILPITVPDLPKIDAAFDKFETSITSALTHELSTVVLELETHVEGWLKNPQSFEDSTLTIIIDLLKSVFDTIFDLIEALITALADLAQALIDSATDVVDWLDTPLGDIPFFSAFYQDVIGDPFTLLDLLCLVVAIPITTAQQLISLSKEDSTKTPGILALDDAQTLPIVIALLLFFWAGANVIVDVDEWALEEVPVKFPWPSMFPVIFLALATMLAFPFGASKKLPEEKVFWIISIILVAWDTVAVIGSFKKPSWSGFFSDVQFMGGVFILFIAGLIWVEKGNNATSKDIMGYSMLILAGLSNMMKVAKTTPFNPPVVFAYFLLQTFVTTPIGILHLEIAASDDVIPSIQGESV